MIEPVSIKFVVKVGIDEYEGFKPYFHAIKFYRIPLIPQMNINIKMLNQDYIKSFHIRCIEFDMQSCQYTIYDNRMCQRYNLGGHDGRIEWAKETHNIYVNHGWQITKIKEY